MWGFFYGKETIMKVFEIHTQIDELSNVDEKLVSQFLNDIEILAQKSVAYYRLTSPIREDCSECDGHGCDYCDDSGIEEENWVTQKMTLVNLFKDKLKERQKGNNQET